MTFLLCNIIFPQTPWFLVIQVWIFALRNIVQRRRQNIYEVIHITDAFNALIPSVGWRDLTRELAGFQTTNIGGGPWLPLLTWFLIAWYFLFNIFHFLGWWKSEQRGWIRRIILFFLLNVISLWYKEETYIMYAYINWDFVAKKSI